MSPCVMEARCSLCVRALTNSKVAHRVRGKAPIVVVRGEGAEWVTRRAEKGLDEEEKEGSLRCGVDAQ